MRAMLVIRNIENNYYIMPFVFNSINLHLQIMNARDQSTASFHQPLSTCLMCDKKFSTGTTHIWTTPDNLRVLVHIPGSISTTTTSNSMSIITTQPDSLQIPNSCLDHILTVPTFQNQNTCLLPSITGTLSIMKWPTCSSHGSITPLQDISAAPVCPWATLVVWTVATIAKMDHLVKVLRMKQYSMATGQYIIACKQTVAIAAKMVSMDNIVPKCGMFPRHITQTYRDSIVNQHIVNTYITPWTEFQNIQIKIV